MTGSDLHCEFCGKRNMVLGTCSQCFHSFCLDCMTSNGICNMCRGFERYAKSVWRSLEQNE